MPTFPSNLTLLLFQASTIIMYICSHVQDIRSVYPIKALVITFSTVKPLITLYNAARLLGPIVSIACVSFNLFVCPMVTTIDRFYCITKPTTGTGCVVTSVKVGSGREPIVVGKPHSPIFKVMQSRYIYYNH